MFELTKDQIELIIESLQNRSSIARVALFKTNKLDTHREESIRNEINELDELINIFNEKCRGKE